MRQNSPKLTFMIALHCEAKPWIDHFRLKKESAQPFDLYRSAEMDLVITGIGAMSMATAVGWIGAQNDCQRIWLNLGTAGHADRPLGDIVRVHGCAASIEGRAHYPPLTAKWSGETDAVLSVNSPSNDYPGGAMVDMEAAAFFNAALRFSSAELVQSIKVISDNQHSGFENLDAPKITALMQPHLDAVNQFAERLHKLAIVADSGASVSSLDEIQGTHSQRRQLSELLHKLNVLGLNDEVKALDMDDNASMKSVLTSLNSLLESTIPVLGEQSDG